MFRFSIRDVLWLTVVVALSVGWWVDRRGWIKLNKELRSEAVKPVVDQLVEGLKGIDDPPYERRSARIHWIYELAQEIPHVPPPPEVASEMLQIVRHDPDFRLRVKAMEVLPYLREREQAIDVLIAALRERDSEKTGAGNVPLYAASNLAQMKATRALPALEDWLNFLKHNEPYIDEEMKQMVIRKTEKHLAVLKADDESM